MGRIINYDSFVLDFDKVTNHTINRAVSELYGYKGKVSEDWAWWNPLGNYVMWNAGNNNSFYFCRNYIRITGIDVFNDKDVDRCLQFLTKYKQ